MVKGQVIDGNNLVYPLKDLQHEVCNSFRILVDAPNDYKNIMHKNTE